MFRPLSGRCGSANFHPFKNLGLSSSIKPENIFGVVSSSSTRASSGHKLVPGSNVPSMDFF